MRGLIVIALPLALAGCYSVDPSARTAYHFVDVRSPHGHSRGVAGERAAGAVCDRQVRTGFDEMTPAYKACMARQGWRYASAHSVRAPAADYAPVFQAADYAPVSNDSLPIVDTSASEAAANTETNDATAQTAQGIADSSASIQAAAMDGR